MSSTGEIERRPPTLRLRSSGRPRSGDASSNTSAATGQSSRTRLGSAWSARCASSSSQVPESRRSSMPSLDRSFRCVESMLVGSSSTMDGEPGLPTSTPRSSRPDCSMRMPSICFRSKPSLRSSVGPRHPRPRRTGRRSGRSAKSEREGRSPDRHGPGTDPRHVLRQGRWTGTGSRTGGSAAGSGIGSVDGTGSVSGRTSNSRFGSPMFIASSSIGWQLVWADVRGRPQLTWSRP
jgi:hypothetical protein